jgi:tetratricopeptide (TPR) repeat protein
MTSGEPERAVESYRAAVAVDANYALAWAGLAQSLVTLADWEVESGGVLQRAADAASRAVSLDASFPSVQQALAQVKVFRDRDWNAAETASRKAITLDPTDVNLRYDLARLVLTPQARFEEAIAELRRALALHPRGNHLLNALAYTYIRAGRFADAAPVVATSLAVAPDAPGAYVLRGMIVSAQAGPDAAVPDFRKAVSLRANAWTRSKLGWALAKSGNRLEAEGLVRQIGDHYHRAAVLLALDRKTEALSALETAYSAYSPSLPWIAVDAEFRGLRGDARFDAIVRKMRLSIPPGD